MLLNGLFHSTMLYGATFWAGAPKYLKAKVQHLQLEACRLANGPHSMRWSKSRLLKSMRWSDLQQLLDRSSAITTHSIINFNEPAILATQMRPEAIRQDASQQKADTCSDANYPVDLNPLSYSWIKSRESRHLSYI